MTIIFGIVSLSCAGFVLLWALSGSRQAAKGPELANTHKKELQTSGLQRVMLPVLSKLGRHIARMLPLAASKLCGDGSSWAASK